nr:SRPBCC domain-containing protein [Variovorax sp. PBS-H4]
MSEGRFLDIVMGERIVSAGTMHRDNIRISATLCTVELTEDVSGGTQVKLTDQSAYLDGSEKPKDRQSGWGKIFEHLGKHLSAGATGDRTKMEGL